MGLRAVLEGEAGRSPMLRGTHDICHEALLQMQSCDHRSLRRGEVHEGSKFRFGLMVFSNLLLRYRSLLAVRAMLSGRLSGRQVE